MEKCSKNIDENELIYNGILNDACRSCKHCSCKAYIVSFFIAFLLIIGISSAFAYFHCYSKKE